VGKRRRNSTPQPPAEPTPEQLAVYAEHEQWVSLHVYRFGRWRARKAGIEVDDLLQAARIGLWRAILTFDASLGCSMATHCRQRIYWSMHEAIDRARYGRLRKGRDLIDQSLFHELLDHDRPGNDPDREDP
jgi:DNA-directed RNA polymerase specialized sigma24 family protein